MHLYPCINSVVNDAFGLEKITSVHLLSPHDVSWTGKVYCAVE